MASTYSTNLAIELIGTGEQSGTWGTTTNTNLGTLLEQAISGYVTQAITDGADTTITIPNGATGVARNMAIEMTGALTATRNLIVPANKKLYFIFNNTSGGFAVTVKVTGLTGVSVPNGKKVILVSNGTDIVEAVNQVVGNLAVGGTLGVTGVATLGNGAILGTPASGTVTNLTGTASININGTVGATTPTTGAFTSGTFSTTLGVTGTSTLAAVNASGRITTGTGSGTSAGLIAGYFGASGYGALWSTGVTPSTTNYAFLTNGSSTGMNGSNDLFFQVNNVGVLAANSTGFTVTGTLGVSGITTIANGTLAAPSLVFAGDADSGFFKGTGASILAGLNGTEVLNINTSTFDVKGGLAANFPANVYVVGALSKGSGSFRISHPLPALNETHQLVHSFIEGPQADLIYRGRIALVAGKATVNIDTAATMTEGTFELLCRDVQCFTSNETDWSPVRGSVVGSNLTIECQDTASIATISWMVIGERKDQHMLDTEWTDDNGKVIVEPLKPIPFAVVEEPQDTNQNRTPQ